MKLIYELIHRELSDVLGCDVMGFDHGCTDYDSVMLYQESVFIEEHLCYISNQLPVESERLSGSTLFILSSPVDKNLLESAPCSTLCFPSDWDTVKVLNLMIQIFTKYNRWEDSLRETLHEVSTVSDLLKASVPIFNNLLLVIDPVFRIVASASPPSKDNELDNYGDMIHSDQVKLIRNEFPRTKKNKKPMLREIPGQRPAWAMNIHDGAFYLGVVCVMETHQKLQPTDAFLLEKLTNSLRKIFILRDVDRVPDRYSLSYILSGLLSGNSPSYDVLDAVSQSSGIAEGDDLYIVAIQNSDHVAHEYSKYFINKLGRIMPVVYIPMDESTTIILIDETLQGVSSQELFASLRDELDASGLRAGISERFNDLINVSLYAQQAIQAARIVMIKKDMVLLSFSDCWLEYVLHAIVGNRPITMQPEGFRRLVEHDAASPRVSYVETLRAYLFNNMNALKAAKSLFITRNSFMSRLERMNSILRMDLSDPQIQFRLMLSLFSLEN